MAKLQIDESRLVAIGDALRVHFGATKKEGTRVFLTESPQTIATTQTIRKHGETKYFYEDNVRAGEEDLGLIPVINNPYKICTFQIPEADHIELDITYFTSSDYYESELNGTLYGHIWIAEGVYSDENKNVGKEYRYKTSQAMEDGWFECPNCGYHCLPETWGWEPFQVVMCPNCYEVDTDGPGSGDTGVTYSMNYKYNDWTRERINIKGNSFSIALKTYVESSMNGYYCDIYAYDADGNLLTSYETIMNEIPNDYSVALMPGAISQLNNYPNGEEEHF